MVKSPHIQLFSVSAEDSPQDVPQTSKSDVCPPGRHNAPFPHTLSSAPPYIIYKAESNWVNTCCATLFPDQRQEKKSLNIFGTDAVPLQIFVSVVGWSHWCGDPLIGLTAIQSSLWPKPARCFYPLILSARIWEKGNETTVGTGRKLLVGVALRKSRL